MVRFNTLLRTLCPLFRACTYSQQQAPVAEASARPGNGGGGGTPTPQLSVRSRSAGIRARARSSGNGSPAASVVKPSENSHISSESLAQM